MPSHCWRRLLRIRRSEVGKVDRRIRAVRACSAQTGLSGYPHSPVQGVLAPPRYFLGEAAFKPWFKREFGITKEEAEQKWANDSAPNSGVPQKVIEGTLKVMVKGHHAVVEEQGQDTGFRTLPQLQLRGNLEIVTLL